MITELTQDQKDKMPKYVTKWIDIGTNTDRLEYDTTLEIVDNFRQLIHMKPAPLKIVENPLEAWIMCCLVKQGVSLDDLETEMKSFFEDNNPKNYKIPKASLPYQTGSLYAPVFSFYDYCYTELDLDDEKRIHMKNAPNKKLFPEEYKEYKADKENKLSIKSIKKIFALWEQTSQVGCIYPLDTVTIVSQKPIIKKNEGNRIHCETGPAIEYGGYGEFKIWALNNIEVPQWLAETDGHKLDVTKYHSLTNADVKAQFVLKAGIERFLDLGKKIDTYENYDQEEQPWWWKSQYELWDMSAIFSSIKYAPHLKMLNQTTGIWHLEPVSPKSRKLPDALKERFDGRDLKIVEIA